MKHTILLLFTLCNAFASFAQKQIQGIVFDTDSKQRISRVYIYNTRTHTGLYNTNKGEFALQAAPGDVLVAAVEGYLVDTINIHTQSTILIYLKRNSILLDQVTITDSTLNAKDQRDKNREEFKDIYRKGNTKDIIQIGGGNGTGGAGLGIDALWSLLSKEGKNARNLQKVIERDYRDQIINYRYSIRLVSSVTGLKSDGLRDFMQQYKPGYNFVLAANDYEMIDYIRTSYERYKQDPSANRLPPLVPKQGQ